MHPAKAAEMVVGIRAMTAACGRAESVSHLAVHRSSHVSKVGRAAPGRGAAGSRFAGVRRQRFRGAGGRDPPSQLYDGDGSCFNGRSR